MSVFTMMLPCIALAITGTVGAIMMSRAWGDYQECKQKGKTRYRVLRWFAGSLLMGACGGIFLAAVSMWTRDLFFSLVFCCSIVIILLSIGGLRAFVANHSIR